MPAREFAIIRQESALGTAVAGQTYGTTQTAVRLGDDSAFGMHPVPRNVRIPWGGGIAVPGTTVSGQTEVVGQLRTRFYASQAWLLMPWWLTRINAGQTVPWTTTELPDDLASCSIYHAVRYGNSTTLKRRRYAGVKVAGGTLAGSAQDQLWTLTLDLIGQRVLGNAQDASSDPNGTEFPEPADTNYPTDPYLFRHLTYSLAGSTRAETTSISLSVRNVVDPQYYTGRFAASINVFGRESAVDAELLFRATPDDWSSHEALTALAQSIVLNDGTRTTTIQMNAQNRLLDWKRVTPVGGVYMARVQAANQWDPAATTDLSVTVA